jgi:hypothetical protein
MKNYLRAKFIHWLVRDLFCALTDEDILTIKLDGSFSYKGKELTLEQATDLQDDAKRFANSAIWKLLTDDAKYHANHLMYENSQDFGGMMFGKAMLYNLDILQKRLSQISKK